jgi:hypothetical protein
MGSLGSLDGLDPVQSLPSPDGIAAGCSRTRGTGTGAAGASAPERDHLVAGGCNRGRR